MSDDTPSPLNNVITIDDERIKSHLDRVVRGTVEETLNALLDAEADRLCNAQRYERSAARRDTRAGHYERNLQTKAGEVRLKVPKLRQQTFEPSGLGEKLGGTFGKSQAGVRDDQPDPAQTALLEMLEEPAPARLVLLGPLADAENLPITLAV